MLGYTASEAALLAKEIDAPIEARLQRRDRFEKRPAGLSIAIDSLRRSFGAKPVLRGIDLSIEACEFVAIVGRSGCGKSTLLRLIAGLDTPTEGHIGFGPTARPRQPLDVRVMFQEPRLLPWANLIENVKLGFGDGPAGASGIEASRAMLDAVGLDGRETDWPGVLSGGQKQRVALARALINSPGVLAFDEPLGALDALTRIEMQSLLERIWVQKNFTALMVTHDVSEAIALGDRVLLIENGVVTLDRRIDLPRPRRRGTPGFAALEREILDRLLGPS